VLHDGGTEALIAEVVRNVCFQRVHIGIATHPASSKVLKQPKLELYPSHIPRADVKKVWSYISIPPCVIMMCKETKFTVVSYSNLSMSWSVHVGFVEDTSANRTIFFHALWLYPATVILQISIQYCIHPPPMLHNLSNQERLLTNRFFPLPALSLSLKPPPRSPRPLCITYLSDYLCSNEYDISNESVVFNIITSWPKLLVVFLTHFTQNTELPRPLSSEYLPSLNNEYPLTSFDAAVTLRTSREAHTNGIFTGSQY
jgi:hypothetical protein